MSALIHFRQDAFSFWRVTRLVNKSKRANGTVRHYLVVMLEDVKKRVLQSCSQHSVVYNRGKAPSPQGESTNFAMEYYFVFLKRKQFCYYSAIL